MSGWYNITDWLGKCRGQIKLSVTPQENVETGAGFSEPEDLNETSTSAVNYVTTGFYNGYPSHLVNHSEQIIFRDGAESSCSLVSELSNFAARNEANGATPTYWQMPELSSEQNHQNLSFMERSLSRHLTDLSNIARNLLRHDSSESSNRTFVITTGQEDKENWNSNLTRAEEEIRRNLDALRNGTGTSFCGGGRDELCSSRTSLQSMSVEELPRDDQPYLTDLGLVLDDLGLYLGDPETERSKAPSENNPVDVTSQTFTPNV